MDIGFIGLGIMGAPMAKNLLAAGHRLAVYDIIESSMDALASLGAYKAKSPKDVAERSSLVITMLPNSPDVKQAVIGPDGVLEGAKPGLALIDMSSISPDASKEIYAACQAKGVEALDAPVSGGEPKAIDGTLAIMVGGNEETFEKWKSLLLCMGSSAILCGPAGSGNVAKLVNQILVAANIAACAEGLTLAQKAGADPYVVLEAIKGGLAGSTALNAKAPMMLAENWKPGFKIDLHTKDLGNVMAAAEFFGSPLLLSPILLKMFKSLQESGFGQEDHSALKKCYDLELLK
ncbi:MAG: 2-hydroxy-3-oxopropionate reductase [Clostridiales bacterium]|jgi:2-hydroxy-3-oxopropionate reductase|nr:2-hydroxy-3-oxopropionate reductase [Clostridiales bacterium]MDR2750146.1 2-hydroxy-3-oxopropionate reductase [Clostridiales bacterium]